MAGSITDVTGLEVGHWTDEAAATGCTVVVCRDGAVGGVDVRGSAPGTRETDLLRPANLVQQPVERINSAGPLELGAAVERNHETRERVQRTDRPLDL